MAAPATPQAQQLTPAPENNKPAISLRVTTRLVQLNVVVNDKNGRPILGLDKDSFTLLDDKKAQRIEFLSIDTNAPTKQAATPLAPDTYTNRVDSSPAQSPNVTVILFDALSFSGALKATGITVRARCIGDSNAGLPSLAPPRDVAGTN